ncbi:MAG: pyruvate kinase [Paracoccaceae bacterium]
MRRSRNVKIVATVGPASSSRGTLRALFDAGVDVFRLNMSHGTHAEQAERIQLIRDIEHEKERPIGILGDLQGPKLRVGRFADGPHKLEIGSRFTVDLDDTPGDESRVCLPHPEIFSALKPGAHLLVNDGKVKLRVIEHDAEHATCEVVVGGEISNNKGVNVPDVVLPLRALTDKDRKDLDFVLEHGVDWIALSFVQRPEDVFEARELIGSREVAIMVKIEKPAAVQRFDEILDACDGVMVARGDLGVEMDNADLPPIQKRLVRKCRAAAKPVVVATQMLESMIASPVPTRAEVTDVANAIYVGADAVMLSAECAAGQYPIEAVTMMNQIAEKVEAEELHRQIIEAAREIDRRSVADAISAAAREVAEATKVKAIACFTHSGATASLLARERPGVPILGLTPMRGTARRLQMVWGLINHVVEPVDRFKLAVVAAVRVAKREGLAESRDNIVVTAGVPFNMPGTTNILRVAPCDEKAIYEGSAEF